jgi:predicted nucleic acid-binding protein
MILADSSIWIDHFKLANLALSRALDDDKVLMHPYVLGELALGSLRDRHRTLSNFKAYDYAPVAHSNEVLSLIENATLFNRGLGYVDAHLLASCLIHGDCRLLTRDRRLRETAEHLGIAA